VWVVVFVVPINAAIDPILYTFTTPKFRRLLAHLFSANGGANHHPSGSRRLYLSDKLLDPSYTQPMIQRRMSWDHFPRQMDPVVATVAVAELLAPPVNNNNPSSNNIEMASIHSPVTTERRNSF
jgi:hypothetical protein